MKDVKFDLLDSFDVQIVTGMDTLSRSGDMDNFMWFVQDMTALAAIPEEIRAAIDPLKLVAFSAGNRGVDYTKFMMSETEFKQKQADAKAAAIAEQGALNSMETAGKVAVEETKANK